MRLVSYEPSSQRNLQTNIFGDVEVYIITAYEWDEHKPREEQAPERSCYCVCDSFQTARDIVEHDTREGRITQASIGAHIIQTKEHVNCC